MDCNALVQIFQVSDKILPCWKPVWDLVSSGGAFGAYVETGDQFGVTSTFKSVNNNCDEDVIFFSHLIYVASIANFGKFMTVVLDIKATFSSSSTFGPSIYENKRYYRLTRQFRSKWQLKICQISAVPEDVARLVGRVKKNDCSVKRQTNLAIQRHKAQGLSDSELLRFERKGHLLTKALVDPRNVHKLAEVIPCQYLELLELLAGERSPES